MGKLYSNKELDLKIDTKEDIENKIENLSDNNIVETIDEYSSDIKIASESFKRASNELFIISDIKASLETKKLASVEYFTSIENYSLYLTSITNNLGIKTKIPSMEDFKNPYGIKTSHKIVLEGFNDFVRSIWEKIKGFFKAFFKKVLLFFKRISNSNLELDEYEEYIDGLISNIKRSKKDRVDNIIIDSKLPRLLAEPTMESINSDFILNKGQRKLTNLLELNRRIFNRDLPDLVKRLSESNKLVKDTLLSKDKLEFIKLKEIISDIRESYLNILNIDLFTNTLSFKSLPENVYDNVLNNFDSKQLEDDNLKVSSLINDRDMNEALPKHFNIYFINSNYAISEKLRTNKLFITPNNEENTYVKNTVPTIGNANNLIKFYEFYKKFSKEFNIKNIDNKIDMLQDEIEDMINDLEKSFKIALENDDTVEDGIIINPPETDTNLNSNNTDSLDNKDMMNEIYELQRFLFNYLNSIQILIHEVSINIVGTYQECRYELVRYIYKSAKQF